MDTTSPTAPPSAPHSAPHTTSPGAPHSAPPTPGLGAELRESLVLLGCAVAVTVGLTTAAQAALTVLG